MKFVQVFIFIGLFFLFLLPANYSQADSSCNFTRHLTVGLKGVDVTCLQLYLQAQGFFKYNEGPTGYFGPITKAAVAKWQANSGIAPTLGYFGPLSQAKYKEITSVQTQTKTESSSLSLPAVSDQEIIINSSGNKTIEDYITYFLKNSSNISFDGQKFEKVLKDENKIFLLVPQLAEKAVKKGVNQQIKESLLVQKEFIDAKLAFLKSIKVSGEAVSLHKKMIGFDKLTLELLQETLNLESNKISKTELDDYLKSYLAVSEIERNKLLKEIGFVMGKPDPFKKLITWLGLEDWFYALAAGLPPFGGTIGAPVSCLCSSAFLVPVGLPTPPAAGFLFVPFSFLGSPIFYANKSMRPGAWWLGFYNPAIIPCLVPCPPACCPVGRGNLIYMTGTSL
jgi:peptidoglycan hydrolase-like protein with peptidoglycan-binding domain